MNWRLIQDSDLPGAVNMARDMALLEAVAEGHSPPVLRLYGWQPACLSLGRNQTLDAADLDFCRKRGLHVVRRPTGGRAVLHHLELTYAVVAVLGRGPVPRALQQAYRKICAPLVAACRSLGIDAALTGGEVNLALPGPRTTIPCFKAPAAGEVVVGDRKLVGSAMRANRRTILQHGSILLDWDGELQAGAMGLADDSSLRPFVTTFAEQLGHVPPREVLKTTIAGAFSSVFKVTLEPDHLTADEQQQATEQLCAYRIDEPC